MPRTTAQTTKRTTKDPTRRRSEAVRWALLNPSRRQLSKWEREQRGYRLVMLAAVALGVVIVAVLGLGYLQQVVLRAQDTVAEVYGERLTAGDLLASARPIYVSFNRQIADFRDRGQAEQAAQLKLQMAALPSQVLNAGVERRLIQREAQNRQLSVSDDEVQADLRERMELEAEFQQSSPPPSPEASPTPPPTLTEAEFQSTYQEFLKRTGLDDGWYRQEVQDNLLRDKLRAAIGAEVATSAEQVHARHILVADEDKAKAVLQKLQEGASFEEVAKAESTDPGSKDKGGDLGWFPRGIMNEPFEQAAFAAEPNAAPQIVRSPNGWHVVQVLEKAQDRSIEASALSALQAKRFQDWLFNARQGPEVKVQLSPSASEWVLNRLQARIF
ncbi:MAG: peptidylprolyl isomerase [Chloroflexi bacterium]|nr:peptidylprolyl isomerase [Chloroflexota bacterium]